MAPTRPVLRQLWHWADRARRSRGLYRNWPAAVTDKWRLRGGLRLYHLRTSAGGASLLASTWADTRIVNELWLSDPYLRFVPEATDVRVVVDIGGNRGYFAVQAALRFPEATIISYEPEPDNLRLLAANVAINDVRVEVEPVALVPDDRTRVQLYQAVHPAYHTTLEPSAAEAAGMGSWRFTGDRVEVEARNVDSALLDVVGRHGVIDVLKIDTEGTELELLGALSDGALGQIRYAVVETPATPDDALRARLGAAGFDVEFESPYLVLRRP